MVGSLVDVVVDTAVVIGSCVVVVVVCTCVIDVVLCAPVVDVVGTFVVVDACVVVVGFVGNRGVVVVIA